MQQKTDVSSASAPKKWLLARKNVHPVAASDLVFKIPKLDKCNSKIVGAKETVCSVKTSSVVLREPTEEDQEEFFLKLDYNASILSIHLKFSKPFIPVSPAKVSDIIC